MNLEIEGNVININSPVVTITDVEKLLQILRSKETEPQIILNIKSFSLPSSIIGELLRLNDKGVAVLINVYDSTLFELLEALKLTNKFKIRKV
ncbi:conserved hypothetical protein [Nautilia profundicola AmH]|uniref:STAS domain-containing protein n=1 Tax=Nautilia profundicola (strain ATCC BAA-1463 / DSM 18972 / AmH) TaxID=598659 RepID=B9L8A3_NAUPA|nr:hypothetical protein [Nautilia profundicola]ACM92354.1 conserved hypothetical protein [Nautilia profundicola AmH]